MSSQIFFCRADGRVPSLHSTLRTLSSRTGPWPRLIAIVGLASMSSSATAQVFPPEIDLSLLAGSDGNAGIVLNGVEVKDLSATSVSVVGDINDDGIDDLLIGAPVARTNVDFKSGFSAGASYVVFGRSVARGFPSEIELASLAEGDGSEGFVLYGEQSKYPPSTSGSGSSGGDLNGDGIDDLIIGNRRLNSVYVVYGRSALSGGFPPQFELEDLLSGDGVPGFVFRGAGVVSGDAGDLNGDGIDDLVATTSGEYAYSYVVFGRGAAAEGLPAELGPDWINDRDESTGFKIGITREFDDAGYATDTGDVNGDGIDDLVLSAPAAEPNHLAGAGEVFVIYGRNAAANNFPEQISLLGLWRDEGNIGFRLHGGAEGDVTGKGLGVGDVNGDGIDDIVIGAPGADPSGRDNAGVIYVVYGRQGDPGVFPDVFKLSSLSDGDGSTGFVVNGIQEQDQFGATLTLGDVNGDGMEDVIVGAKSTGLSTGRTYVVFGRDSAQGGFPAEFELSTIIAEGRGKNGVVLFGLDPIERISSPIDEYGKSFDAGDINGDGVDDMVLGDKLADPGDRNNAGKTFVVFGESAEAGD